MSQKKARISWTLEGLEKTFLEACIHEVNVNGREGGSLKAVSWRIVAEKLKKEHNLEPDQKQMKNRYDYIKAKYGAWVKLKNKTGNVYDPITNMFNLSEEEWQLEIKSNKHVETLRRAPLLFPTLCTQLFDGATSTDIQSWGPTSTLPRPFRESTVPSVNESDDVDSTQREPISDESSAQSKKRKGKETANTTNSMLTEVGEDISKVAKLLLDKYASSNMAACMEKLEKLGWGKTDPRYSTAILFFGESADMREVWLLIDPTICETWVRNAGAKYKLL